MPAPISANTTTVRRESFGTNAPHASTARRSQDHQRGDFRRRRADKGEHEPNNGVRRRGGSRQSKTIPRWSAARRARQGDSQQSNMDSGRSQESPAQARGRRATTAGMLDVRPRRHEWRWRYRAGTTPRYGQDEQKPVDLKQRTDGCSDGRNECIEIRKRFPFVPEIEPRNRMCGDHPRHRCIEGQVARRRPA